MNQHQPSTAIILAGLLSVGSLSCAKTRASGTSSPKNADAAAQQHRLNVDGTDLSLYLPANASPPLPAVLVFHSALGPTQAVHNYAAALAKDGFAACVLDLYEGQVADNASQATALRDNANARLPALTNLITRTYSSLRSDPRVFAPRRYLLGWSYGGAWATYAAGFLEDVAGVVAIYGHAFRP